MLLHFLQIQHDRLMCLLACPYLGRAGNIRPFESTFARSGLVCDFVPILMRYRCRSNPNFMQFFCDSDERDPHTMQTPLCFGSNAIFMQFWLDWNTLTPDAIYIKIESKSHSCRIKSKSESMRIEWILLKMLSWIIMLKDKASTRDKQWHRHRGLCWEFLMATLVPIEHPYYHAFWKKWLPGTLWFHGIDNKYKIEWN